MTQTDTRGFLNEAVAALLDSRVERIVVKSLTMLGKKKG